MCPAPQHLHGAWFDNAARRSSRIEPSTAVRGHVRGPGAFSRHTATHPHDPDHRHEDRMSGYWFAHRESRCWVYAVLWRAERRERLREPPPRTSMNSGRWTDPPRPLSIWRERARISKTPLYLFADFTRLALTADALGARSFLLSVPPRPPRAKSLLDSSAGSIVEKLHESCKAKIEACEARITTLAHRGRIHSKKGSRQRSRDRSPACR